MTVLTVHYPNQSGTFFDLDYYIHKHVPMVKTLLTPRGLKEFRLFRGIGTPAGTEAVYEMTALLVFATEDDFRDAMAQYEKQILGDIPNFTDMRAALQLNEELEP